MAKKKPVKKKSRSDSANKPTNKLASTLLQTFGISLLIVVIAFVFLGLFERHQINMASIKSQSQTLADSQANLVNLTLTQLRNRLAAAAASPEILTALEGDDDLAIKNFEAELIRSFPEATTIKLIPMGPLGIAKINRENYGLRNEIEMSLLRLASDGQKAEPEAYQINNQWMFSLSEPVQAADKSYANGAILLSLDGTFLQRVLTQQDSAQGQTTLIQQFNNKQHTISTVGTAGDASYQQTADTLVSNWQINYTPSYELISRATHGALFIWVALAVSALVILALGFVAISLLQKAINENLAALIQGKSATTFSLPGFENAAADIRSKLQSAPKAADTEQAKEPTKKPESKPAKKESDKGGVNLPQDLPETIFRAYDIRGLAEQQLTDEVVYAIGLAIGSEALDQGQQTLVVAADGRHSSPRIRDAMVKGLTDSGRDVIDIGIMPTPLMYFATHQLGAQSGVMITGSHNPAEYNGIKIVIGGRALSGPAISALRTRVLSKDLATGKGQVQTREIAQDYIDYIINDVAIAQPLKVVIDAGNGVAGAIAPRLFEELGCEVIQLYCEVNGDFPNHHPDPTVEANLEDLKQTVQQNGADLGIAFDGDGDRLGVVTATGKSIPADRLLMLFAQDVVSRNPGADVLFDVKCTRNLNNLISNYGGRPIMWKTGHSFMKDKMAETGALLGGEFSGHIFFKERWFGFDDGMYAAARLIEILSTTDPDLDVQLSAFPESIGSPELKIETDENNKFAIIESLVNQGQFGDGKISTLDGVRVDFPDGWGLVRASNTTPMLILRFEAENDGAMERIKNLFKDQLISIDNSLQFGF